MTNFPKTKKCIKHHKIMTYREINSKLISQDCTKFRILEIFHVRITDIIQSELINMYIKRYFCLGKLDYTRF